MSPWLRSKKLDYSGKNLPYSQNQGVSKLVKIPNFRTPEQHLGKGAFLEHKQPGFSVKSEYIFCAIDN
jgi:hypothetical protein